MIKTVYLKDYFQQIGYDWESDLKELSVICNYTKTRVDPTRKEGQMTFGQEQTFLIKAIAQHIGAKSFFEIGTGRGTACYAVSLEPTIDKIVTVDIMSFYDKMNTAIGYKAATVSNKDIYDLIPFKEKEKVIFKHRSELTYGMDEYENEFDFVFIDGDHDNVSIIQEDYRIAKFVVKDGSPIIFDDYHPTKFAVKSVVDNILLNDSNLEATLIVFSGHLFAPEKQVDNYGVLLLTKQQ